MPESPKSPVPIGREATFTKTVSESDVYLYAGITGDFSPNHVNQVYMERSVWGRRMAHGMLLAGFISTASTMAIADTRDGAEETPVAVGNGSAAFPEAGLHRRHGHGVLPHRAVRRHEAAHLRQGRGHEPGR